MGLFRFAIELFLVISCTTGICAKKERCPQFASQNSNTNLTVTIHVTAVRKETFAAIKPFLLLTRDNCYTGFIPELLEKISKITRFNFQIKAASDDTVGARLSDGSFLGIIGEITRKEADIAAGPISITSFRRRVVDFSVPFMKSGLVIIFKRPMIEEEVPFMSVEELLSSGVPIGCVRDGTCDYLKHKSLPKPMRLYQEIKDRGYHFDSFDVAFRQVWRGNLALVVRRDQAIYALKQKPCNTVIVGEPVAELDYALALQKGQPQKQIIDMALQQLQEQGEIKRIKDKYWGKNCDCDCWPNCNCNCDTECGSSQIYWKGWPSTSGQASSLPYQMAFYIVMLMLVIYV